MSGGAVADRWHDGGLTPDDREWLARQLALTMPVKVPAPSPRWLDVAMPYVPAFTGATMLAALVGVISVSIGAPRVWPGVLLMFVLNFLSLARFTWSLQRLRSNRGGRRG